MLSAFFFQMETILRVRVPLCKPKLNKIRLLCAPGCVWKLILYFVPVYNILTCVGTGIRRMKLFVNCVFSSTIKRTFFPSDYVHDQ